MKKGNWMRFCSMILICVLLLCACGSDRSQSSGGNASVSGEQEQKESSDMQAGGGQEAVNPEDLPTVVYYTWTYGQNQENKEKVFEKLNEITREKIGCNLEVHLVNTSEFEQQMQNKLGAGEQIDLMFTSNWLNLYSALIAREALLPIEDLLPVYAPEYYNMIPEEWWNCTKVGGHIYGAINQQIFARQPYIAFDANIVDEVGFDWQSVEGFEDLTKYFELISEKGYNIREWQYWVYPDPTTWNEYLEYEPIGGDLVPGVISYENDGKPVVFNQFETEEFKELLELFRSWYDKGYTPADALTTLDRKIALRPSGARIPYQTETTEAQFFEAANLVESPVYVKNIGEPFITTGSVIGTMISVTVNSKYPEKAVEVLNLINTDPEFYNTFIWGIEGEDYALDEEGKAVILDTNKYDDLSLRNWAYGNTFIGYVSAGTDARVWEETDQLNRSATMSSLLGFNFDATSLATEVSNCNAVIAEYIQPLIMGLLDLDTALPEFTQRLKDAGADTIIAEKQAQIDAFWEANH